MILLAELVVVLVASCVQGLTGFGFAVVAVPLLATLGGLDDAIAIAGLLGLWASVNTIRSSHPDIHWPVVRSLLRGTAIGLPVGMYVVHLIDTRRLTVVTGVVVLALAAALLMGLQIRCTRPIAQGVTGVLSGTLGACTGMTGPPVVIALRGTDLSAAATRATLAVTLGTAGAAILALRTLTGHVHVSSLPVVALAVPLVWAGNRVGQWVFARVTPAGYRAVVMFLLVVSGGAAIVPR